MNGRYIIYSIDPTNGEYNPYHDDMRGGVAEIGSVSVGDGLVVRYIPKYDDHYHYVVTSPVKSVKENDNTLVIETANTIYTLHVVKNAEFTSVWDGGFAVTTGCKVDMVTKEVFDIEESEGTADEVNCLDEEYVTIDGQDYPVVSDEYMESDPEEEGSYWYQE